MNNDRCRYISRLSENRFEQFCIASDLSFSSPNRDEEGWDAFVEFPPNMHLAVHRDGQPPAIKSLVQVKSTDEPVGSAISMKILNWEKLAKSTMPSFMAILFLRLG